MRFGFFAILAISLVVFSGAAVSADCIDIHPEDFLFDDACADNHVNLPADDYFLIHQNNADFDYDTLLNNTCCCI